MQESHDSQYRPGTTVLPAARRDDVIHTDIDGEVLVYDLLTSRAHCLNPLASAVWSLLDGSITSAEAVTQLRPQFGVALDADTVWLAVAELSEAGLLVAEDDTPAVDEFDRRQLLHKLMMVAGGAALLPVIASLSAPTAYASASGVACGSADTCATFSCEGSCACVTTTEGATVCIVPTCVAPCTTTADCPAGTVCFTLGCCGPATYCVPIAPPGTNCASIRQGSSVPGSQWPHS